MNIPDEPTEFDEMVERAERAYVARREQIMKEIAASLTMTHHPTTRHDLFTGFWVTCDCAWSGPARPAKHLATMTHETHVREAKR